MAVAIIVLEYFGLRGGFHKLGQVFELWTTESISNEEGLVITLM